MLRWFITLLLIHSPYSGAYTEERWQDRQQICAATRELFVQTFDDMENGVSRDDLFFRIENEGLSQTLNSEQQKNIVVVVDRVVRNFRQQGKEVQANRYALNLSRQVCCSSTQTMALVGRQTCDSKVMQRIEPLSGDSCAEEKELYGKNCAPDPEYVRTSRLMGIRPTICAD